MGGQKDKGIYGEKRQTIKVTFIKGIAFHKEARVHCVHHKRTDYESIYGV